MTDRFIVKETGKAPPLYPTMFMKASTAVHDHGKDIVIPAIAQDEQADYEGELVCSNYGGHFAIDHSSCRSQVKLDND